jgi:hypothetical protein
VSGSQTRPNNENIQKFKQRRIFMKLGKLMTVFVVGALVISGVVGAVVYRSASAASAAQSGSTDTGTTGNTPPGPGMGGGHFDKGPGGYTDEDLATALGISVDELTAAYQSANEAALSQAVEAGLITQAQADELKSKGSAFPFGKGRGGWLKDNDIDFNALLADALGITVDQLKAAYTQAYYARIDQAVTDGTLTQEQADLMKGQNALYANENFQSTMKSAFESAVAQAVADGVITQAQADQILANTNNMDFGGMPGFGGPHGFGGFDGGGHGPHGGWNDYAPNDPNAPASTETPSGGDL